jgi:spermidine synthase
MAQNTSTSPYLPPILFSVTLFISAGLLFWIQPLIAKTLLPLWGGTPAVWNTCLLFFQTLLLIGYVYALASATWLSVRAQAAIHVLLLILIAIYLFVSPIHAPSLSGLQQANPKLGVLQTLLFSIGLPFFIISASNPLLQSWFSRLQHQRARDPYFLFAASNGGSLIALVAFPLALEPLLGLNQQYKLWRIGFAVLVTLICAIAFVLKPTSTVATTTEETPNDKLSVWRRLRWLALAFVPSSLMLGVTTYITADVAAVPLLWVIPLALYLLTFVLAFTNKQLASAATLTRVMFVAALIVILILASGATEPTWLLILANLGFFFVAALTCHGQLANDRPSTTHLAEYYLWIAIGGALGSFFNVLIAPSLFTSVLEYPLVIAIACMLQRIDSRANVRDLYYLDIVYPAGLYVLYVTLTMLVRHLQTSSDTIKLLIVPGIPLIFINHFFRYRPIRFGLALCAVVLASVYYTGDTSRTLQVARNFFGTIRVTTDSIGRINSFYSGNTVHGRQFVDQSRQCEPLSYHHEQGPLGQVMAVFNAHPANSRVGVVGLGVGAMAAYSKPDQQWTFYEINPAVINLARNSPHFTYLRNCASGSVNVVEGDARLNLQDAPEGHYGLIVLDAFSSDAIPVHLVTQQALDLYLSKLAEGGILVFHASSRSLDLKPILGDLAASRDLECISFDDLEPTSIEAKDPSQWVVMARSSPDISYLSINSQWKRLDGKKGARVWSDDFSNIVRAIKWQ